MNPTRPLFASSASASTPANSGEDRLVPPIAVSQYSRLPCSWLHGVPSWLTLFGAKLLLVKVSPSSSPVYGSPTIDTSGTTRRGVEYSTVPDTPLASYVRALFPRPPTLPCCQSGCRTCG